MGIRGLRRYWIRHRIRTGRNFRAGESPVLKPPIPPIILTLAVALLVGIGTILWLQAKLRPMVSKAAQTQVQNTVIAVMDQAVAESLEQRSTQYSDLVTVQRGEDGAITALTTDSAAMNQLRLELVSDVLAALEGIDVSQLKIPLGSLVDSELVWARGPSITVRALWVGTVSGEFESEFSSAGVNQTMHRIWLALSVPVTVLLPGESFDLTVSTQVCIAETVIVGQVPQLYTLPPGTPSP